MFLVELLNDACTCMFDTSRVVVVADGKWKEEGLKGRQVEVEASRALITVLMVFADCILALPPACDVQRTP